MIQVVAGKLVQRGTMLPLEEIPKATCLEVLAAAESDNRVCPKCARADSLARHTEGQVKLPDDIRRNITKFSCPRCGFTVYRGGGGASVPTVYWKVTAQQQHTQGADFFDTAWLDEALRQPRRVNIRVERAVPPGDFEEV